jgi:hypothetical protein
MLERALRQPSAHQFSLLSDDMDSRVGRQHALKAPLRRVHRMTTEQLEVNTMIEGMRSLQILEAAQREAMQQLAEE